MKNLLALGDHYAPLYSAVETAIVYCTANAERGHLRAALVYLHGLETAIELYGEDAVPTQMLYILNNLGAWRGADARAAKAVFNRYSKESK